VINSPSRAWMLSFGISLIIGWFVSLPAQAETVLARPDKVTEGQAYVFRLTSGCFAATPVHVIADAAGKLRVPILMGRQAREGQASDPLQPDPELDLAFVRVTGALASPCGSVENLGLDNLDSVLPGLKELKLEVARTGAAIQQIPVELVTWNEKAAQIRPARRDQSFDSLMQSMSGGTIVDARGVPIGMLVKVNTDDGVGEAIRFDHVRKLALQRLQESVTTVAAASAAKAEFRVLEWTGVTSDPTHRPADVLNGGTWQVEPVVGRADLTLTSSRQIPLSSLRVAHGDAGAREADVMSIFMKGPAGGDWTLLQVCKSATGGGPYLFDCPFAQKELSSLRLEFGVRNKSKEPFTVGPIELR
jgi:hypothetical protein